MTSAVPPVPERPFGVGRIGPRYLVMLTALLGLVAWGVVGYVRQLVLGEQVTGLRDVGTMGGAAWGLYIAFVVYFVGVSFAGITVAAMIRLFNLTHLRPVARMAELLTIVALLLGAASVLVDLGQPDRGLINLFRYARPESPFFGTFSLVLAGYLFASLVYFYLDGRRDAYLMAQRPGRLQGFYRAWAGGYADTIAEHDRHDRTSFWLSLAIIPLLVIAHSTLGFVFGLQAGRPGWFSALQAPGFVVMAGVSGIGHIIVIAYMARRFLHLEAQLPTRVFAWLGNFLWILIAAYLYFLLVEMLTGIYAARHDEVSVTKALLVGHYAWLFWLAVGLLLAAGIAQFTQFVTRRYSIPLIVLVAVMVNVAAMAKRYLIVVPGQTHGRLLPYEVGSYTPTWVEFSIVVGLMALGAVAMLLFFKAFPIMHLDHARTGSEAHNV